MVTYVVFLILTHCNESGFSHEKLEERCILFHDGQNILKGIIQVIRNFQR